MRAVHPYWCASTLIVAAVLVIQPGSAWSQQQPYHAPYCGIYCIYAYCESEGFSVDFEALADARFVPTLEGSSADNLVDAAREVGVHAQTITGLTVNDLSLSPNPIILHVRSRRESKLFDHWILYCGEGEGKVRVVDPSQKGEVLLSPGQLQAIWDGAGVMLSRSRWTPIAFLYHIRLLWIVVIGSAVIAIKHTLGRTSMLRPAASGSVANVGSYLLGISVVVAMSCATAMIYHTIVPWGFIRDMNSSSLIGSAYYVHHFAEVTDEQLIKCIDKVFLNTGDVVIVDARFVDDYLRGHVPGAVNIPVDMTYEEELAVIAPLPRSTFVVVYCQSESCGFDESVGKRLIGHGFKDVALFQGGYRTYRNWHSGNNRKAPEVSQ